MPESPRYVVDGPQIQRAERCFQRSAQRRDAVFHGDLRGRDDATGKDAVAFEATQGLRQGFLSLP